MELIRPLVLHTMLCNMQFKAVRIEGRINSIAEAIPRKQWLKFRLLAPVADVLPTNIPPEYLDLILELKVVD